MKSSPRTSEDPLVDEDPDDVVGSIHRGRRALSERFGDDMAAICEDARRRAEASGRRIIRRGELIDGDAAPDAPPVRAA